MPRAASARAVGAMPPKLTPSAIAGTLDELTEFADTSAAPLAVRNGTDMLSSLRQNQIKEEQRFFAYVISSRDHPHTPIIMTIRFHLLPHAPSKEEKELFTSGM